MARVVLPQSRVRLQRRRRWFILSAIVVSCVLLVVGLLVWLSWAPFLKITTIEIVGAKTLATSTIEKKVEQQLADAYLYVFAKNNILIYPKSQIASALLSDIPTLKEVQVRAKTFSSIEVVVTERDPKALWCGESAPVGINMSSPCFLLDQNGVAYAAAANFSGDAYKKYFGSLMGSTTPKHFLTEDQFHALSALADALASQQKDNMLTSVAVDSEKDVRARFANGFVLVFSLNTDGGDVYQRFTLGLSAEPFTTHHLSDFEYLDLRFGDKLYYKLK